MTHVFRSWPVKLSLLRREEIAAQAMRKGDRRAPARRDPRNYNDCSTIVQRQITALLLHKADAATNKVDDSPGS